VLDDIEARRVLEQPPGEEPPPFGSRIGIGSRQHDDLDERAGLGRLLPRCGSLAGGEPHDHVADAARFAGFHLEVAGDVVALVEQAEHRDAVFHRGADGALRGDLLAGAGEFLGDLGRFGLGLGRVAIAGGKERERGQSGGQPHASGVHAS